MTCVEATEFDVHPYDLAATLNSGQAFRWCREGPACEGVVGDRWVRLTPTERGIRAETVAPCASWDWLRDYLQVDTRLEAVLATFPDDPILTEAVHRCRGLRLLRQDPWECLASFVLSSTKQIVQIRQMIALLCARYGTPIPVPPGRAAAFSFPTPSRLAACSAAELRECKLGFRAEYLQGIAARVADGTIDLPGLLRPGPAGARAALQELPGVGRKIAECVLLFAYGVADAFPIDVWIERTLRRWYFARRRVTRAALERFVVAHFGPHAGYAQQYLFHYVRTHPTPETVRPAAPTARPHPSHPT